LIDAGCVTSGYSTNCESPHSSVFSRAQRATYSRRNAALAGVSGRGGRSGSSVRIVGARSTTCAPGEATCHERFSSTSRFGVRAGERIRKIRNAADSAVPEFRNR
jgi:hypothetical protein